MTRARAAAGAGAGAGGGAGAAGAGGASAAATDSGAGGGAAANAAGSAANGPAGSAASGPAGSAAGVRGGLGDAGVAGVVAARAIRRGNSIALRLSLSQILGNISLLVLLNVATAVMLGLFISYQTGVAVTGMVGAYERALAAQSAALEASSEAALEAGPEPGAEAAPGAGGEAGASAAAGAGAGPGAAAGAPDGQLALSAEPSAVAMFRGTAVTPVLYDRYSLVPGREESVPGFRLADSACRLITLPVGTTVEGLWQKTAGVRLDDRWMHLAFTFHVPTGEPGYSYYHVELVQDSLLYYLWLAGVIIATLEVLVMARRAVEIHKRTLRILQPITDLTLAAQSVGLGAGLDAGFGAGAGGGWGAGSGFGAGGAAAAAGRGEEPRLKVSGAIDALNAINELHLDRRVSIDDERVELKGLAQAINGMLDRIAAAYRSQLRFVSDASHELRTPIAVIQGYANLLDRWGKNDPKALQESIDAIKNEAEGMKLLVEQLLFLARGDNRGIALALERADLALVVGEAAREAEMIDGGRHEYRAAIEPGLSVLGDVALIKQAARIFIENSIKYTPEGGRITVRAWRREGGGVSFSVTDSGIGIPAEALPHVFERFFRADESRARKTGGTGLGLSIAKWIVDAHGGSIEVLSRVDAGTRFTVTFPGADAAPGDAAPDSAEAGLGDAAPAADAPDGAAPGAAAASAPSPPAPDAATGPDGGEGPSPPAA